MPKRSEQSDTLLLDNLLEFVAGPGHPILKHPITKDLRNSVLERMASDKPSATTEEVILELMRDGQFELVPGTKGETVTTVPLTFNPEKDLPDAGRIYDPSIKVPASAESSKTVFKPADRLPTAKEALPYLVQVLVEQDSRLRAGQPEKGEDGPG